MSDNPVERAEKAQPIFPIVPVDVSELAELAKPGTPAGFDETFDFPFLSNEYPEVDEDEVRDDNWQDHLPLAGPDLGIALDPETGLLTPDEQVKYDQDPPEPQDSYEDGIGI